MPTGLKKLTRAALQKVQEARVAEDDWLKDFDYTKHIPQKLEDEISKRCLEKEFGLQGGRWTEAMRQNYLTMIFANQAAKDVWEAVKDWEYGPMK